MMVTRLLIRVPTNHCIYYFSDLSNDYFEESLTPALITITVPTPSRISVSFQHLLMKHKLLGNLAIDTMPQEQRFRAKKFGAACFMASLRRLPMLLIRREKARPDGRHRLIAE